MEIDLILFYCRFGSKSVTKPLRMDELLARIYAQLQQFEASDDAQFELADLNFIPANKMLHNNKIEMP